MPLTWQLPKAAWNRHCNSRKVRSQGSWSPPFCLSLCLVWPRGLVDAHDSRPFQTNTPWHWICPHKKQTALGWFLPGKVWMVLCLGITIAWSRLLQYGGDSGERRNPRVRPQGRHRVYLRSQSRDTVGLSTPSLTCLCTLGPGDYRCSRFQLHKRNRFHLCRKRIDV